MFQECLEKFLQGTGGLQNRELLMVHYLQQANYIPALQLNHSLKMNLVVCLKHTHNQANYHIILTCVMFIILVKVLRIRCRKLNPMCAPLSESIIYIYILSLYISMINKILYSHNIYAHMLSLLCS